MGSYYVPSDAEPIDEDDIRERYQDKPDQLASILAKAPTHFCQTRKVTLYADPAYKSNLTDSTEVVRLKKRTLELEQQVKAAKKAKAKAKPKPDAAVGEGKSLTASARRKLGKLLEKVTKTEKELSDAVDAVEDQIAEHIPAYAVRKASASMHMCASAKETLQVAIGNVRGDVEKLVPEAEASLKNGEPALATLVSFIQEAHEHIASLGQDL